ncbi:MAG: hypothetical protein ACOX83_06365 [Candidatus Spyradocola sp.]
MLGTTLALFALIVVLLLALLVLSVQRPASVPLTQSPAASNTLPASSVPSLLPEATPTSTDTIAIPGYEGLTLRAGEDLCLANPEQNTCYFVITLSLADGTPLWQSSYIPPGEVSDPIRLLEPLEPGVYSDAQLTYACFSMDEALTPLNGAQMELTLRVE